MLKLATILMEKIMKNEQENIKVKNNQSSSYFFLLLSMLTNSVKYLNNRKKIDEEPKLPPKKMSFNTPRKNKFILEGIILNFLIHK
jgi:hypothetical protein